MSNLKESTKIALLYHANLNHFSLSTSGRNSLASQYMSDMVEHIQVPVAFSMPAEDLLYLYLHYPETYTDLVSNPYITFLLSTYAHTIAAYDFGSYVEQAQLGKTILETLVPQEKLVTIGYPSEVDVPKNQDLTQLQALWNTIILGDTRILPKQDVDQFYWKVSDESVFPTILSRRENLYRNVFHKFFRAETPAEDVVSALERDGSQWSHNNGYLARIDFETPMFNEIVYPNGNSTGPRIDLWQQLNEAYAKRPGLFTEIHAIQQRMHQGQLKTTVLEHDPIEDPKWQFKKHAKEIESLGRSTSEETPLRYAWLSTHHSDYFCTEKKDWTFKTHGNGIVRIVKKQIYREPELLAKFDLLQDKDYSGDNKAVGDYLKKLTDVYTYLTEGKHETNTECTLGPF